jgi:hypothetical protein
MKVATFSIDIRVTKSHLKLTKNEKRISKRLWARDEKLSRTGQWVVVLMFIFGILPHFLRH